MSSFDGTPPNYLYHYTDVDSLALILKNKTIRFNSLEKMDDLQEQSSNDLQNFGRFVFVSSWTSNATESIPMWRMYAPKKRGVRIKLPSNPFVKYKPSADELSLAFGVRTNIENHTKEPQPALELNTPPRIAFSDSYYIMNCTSKTLLYKVIYTDDDSLLNPTVLKIADGKFNIKLDLIGTYKNTYWAFQDEWRYKLFFLPMSIKQIIFDQTQGNNEEMKKMQKNIMAGKSSLPFSSFDLVLRDDCFSDMSITLSPDISESAKTIAELLIKEYNSTCTIHPSALTNLLK